MKPEHDSRIFMLVFKIYKIACLVFPRFSHIPVSFPLSAEIPTSGKKASHELTAVQQQPNHQQQQRGM